MGVSDTIVDKLRVRGALVGQVLVGTLDGGQVYMLPADLGAIAEAAGHWEPVCDGDELDPQPVYIENADGVNDFLMMWVVP